MGKIHDALQRAEEERAQLATVFEEPGDDELLGAPGEDEVPRRRALQFLSAIGSRLRSARLNVIPAVSDASATEEYRSVRQRIHSLRRAREIRSIVVTSALAGEGKTTTAINLAHSFGLEAEANTCLVDCDMRAPGVHHALPTPPALGLVELLDGDAKLEDVLIRLDGTRLSVLPVRALPTQPSELLASRKMSELLDELHTRFDTVVLDAPPIAGLPDATALVDLCDAALLVVAAQMTQRDEIDAALDRIDRTKILGTVFNRFGNPVAPYGYGSPGFRSR